MEVLALLIEMLIPDGSASAHEDGPRFLPGDLLFKIAAMSAQRHDLHVEA